VVFSFFFGSSFVSLLKAFNADTKSAHVQGRPIMRGDIVVLRHMATNTWLHSHLHSSPLSNNQEVSAYQYKDDSNFWEVQNDMVRGEPVRLKHVATDKYLAMNPQRYGHPIPNQWEVAAVSSPGPNTVWVTTHGIYFEPTNDVE
jgi:dolichyl-phosphate-mannose--protein O-mannosyl transferase